MSCNVEELKKDNHELKTDCKEVFRLIKQAKRTSNGIYLDKALMILCKWE